MALRSLLGCLSVAALAVCTWTACKGTKTQASAADLDKRCVQLGRACGDSDKHNEKIVKECKQAVTMQVEKGCAGEASAVYDCYEKQLCGKGDKVWAIDDLRVLADRESKCVAERNAGRECLGK